MTTPNTSTSKTTPNFEFFHGTLSESSARPRITVRRGGLMVISQATVNMIGDGVDHVRLAYDAKSGTVGIQAASEGSSGSYRLRTQSKSPSRLVSGKRFFQHHDLKVEVAKTYPAQDFGNGIVGFTLEGVGEVPKPAEANEATPAPKPAAKKAAGRKLETAA